MRSMEFTGRSVDEAVFHGLQEMGVSIDQVEIETLQMEFKGLFGIGSKMARVRLTEKMEEETLPETESFRPEPNQRVERPRREQGERRSRGDRGDRLERRPREREEYQREERQPREELPQYDYTLEAAKDLPAAEFLQELLEKMGVQAQVLACITEDGLRLRIDSSSMGILIGRRGETLDAMQYITSLVVNRNRKQEGYLRVTLDTEDYRNKREETLRRLARKQASRVKASGRSVALEPMNPYERRVLHATLQTNHYVTTHSEGEEPNRRVVIEPKH